MIDSTQCFITALTQKKIIMSLSWLNYIYLDQIDGMSVSELYQQGNELHLSRIKLVGLAELITLDLKPSLLIDIKVLREISNCIEAGEAKLRLMLVLDLLISAYCMVLDKTESSELEMEAALAIALDNHLDRLNMLVTSQQLSSEQQEFIKHISKQINHFHLLHNSVLAYQAETESRSQQSIENIELPEVEQLALLLDIETISDIIENSAINGLIKTLKNKALQPWQKEVLAPILTYSFSEQMYHVVNISTFGLIGTISSVLFTPSESSKTNEIEKEHIDVDLVEPITRAEEKEVCNGADSKETETEIGNGTGFGRFINTITFGLPDLLAKKSEPSDDDENESKMSL